MHTWTTQRIQLPKIWPPHKCSKTTVCEKMERTIPDCSQISNYKQDSNECEIWKREKEIIRIKYTKTITFPKASETVNNTYIFIYRN